MTMDKFHHLQEPITHMGIILICRVVDKIKDSACKHLTQYLTYNRCELRLVFFISTLKPILSPFLSSGEK